VKLEGRGERKDRREKVDRSRCSLGKRERMLPAETFNLLLHPIEHCEYFLIVPLKHYECRFIKVIAAKSKLQPCLRFGCFLACITQLIYENSFIFSLPPDLNIPNGMTCVSGRSVNTFLPWGSSSMPQKFASLHQTLSDIPQGLLRL
jgi:hypothetical protein